MRRIPLAPAYAAAGIIVGLAAFTIQKPSSFEIKTAAIDVVAGNQGIVEVLCSAGKKATGGGFNIGGGAQMTGPDVAVYESSPRVTSGVDGWRLVAVNRGTMDRRLDIYVVCG